MARETEIKLRINDLPALHRALGHLGASLAGPGASRVHEQNVIFDTPNSNLYKKGQLLRIRTETPVGDATSEEPGSQRRVILTFKQPTESAEKLGFDGASEGPYKVREEIELEVSDAGALTRIFETLGMHGWFQYEKYRTTFRLPNSQAWANDLLIELDETPIGTFVELEGPREAIGRAAGELGFRQRDYIVESYLGLYLEECRRRGVEPRHMLFSEPRVTSKS